jgi:hypothetical protein
LQQRVKVRPEQVRGDAGRRLLDDNPRAFRLPGIRIRLRGP